MPEMVVPVSAFLMGIVAVVIQWLGDRSLSRQWHTKMFKRVLLVTLISFALLVITYMFVVVSVPIQFGATSVRYVVGFKRPVKEPCGPELSDADCIARKLTLNPRKIESFWGDGQVRVAKLSLLAPYLVLTGSFGMLVGLALLQNEKVRRTRSSHRKSA
jgi:hypothetical protein